MAASPRSVRRNPVKFEATEIPITDTIKEAVESIVAKMTWGTNETILDHGHNSGKKVFEVLAPLAEKTSSTVYILDNCPHTIEHAETKFPHVKILHIFGDLSLPPGTLGDLKFNKIFSLYGMYHTVDNKGALKSLYEHMLPGGEAFFMIPTKAHVYDLNRLLCGHTEFGEHAEEHFPVSDYIHDGKDNSENLKDALIATGLELTEFDVVKNVVEFKDVRDFAGHQITSYHRILSCYFYPRKKHDELEEIYYKHYAEIPTELYTPGVDSPDAKYRFSYDCAYIFAKKPE